MISNFSKAKQQWPLILSLTILWVTTAVVTLLVSNNTLGHLTYVLDDPYIHMAVAKNFVSYGVWGVTKYGFTSVTSSILWPGLIAVLFKIFGINELIPLFLNIIFAAITLIIVNCVLKQCINKSRFSNIFIFLVLIAIIFFTPLIPLIFTGMEHVLQILLTVFFVYKSAIILRGKNKNSELILLLVLAMLLTLNRYESFFTVFTVVIFFVIYRKPFTALYLFVAGLVPLVAYGLISTVQGWYFLPNSLILKSAYVNNLLSLDSLFIIILKQLSLLNNHHLLILMILAFSLIILLPKICTDREYMDFKMVILFIFCINLILHLLIANTGWFYRYDAYLVVMGLIAITFGVSSYLKKFENLKFDKKTVCKYLIIIFVIWLFMLPLVTRGYASITSVPQASKNIYEQQYQMALFIKEYYPRETVALNDIGAVNFMNDVRCLDLYGLSSFEVAQNKKEGNYGSEKISELVKKNNVSVVIIYKDWFGDKIPPDWIEVCQWKIKDEVMIGPVISFFVVNPEDKQDLTGKLKGFSSKLPNDVEVTYID